MRLSQGRRCDLQAMCDQFALIWHYTFVKIYACIAHKALIMSFCFCCSHCYTADLSLGPHCTCGAACKRLLGHAYPRAVRASCSCNMEAMCCKAMFMVCCRV